MKPDKSKQKKLTLWILGIAAACIILYLGLRNLPAVANAVTWIAGVFSPLILGFFIALILNVPMRFFEGILWPKATKPFGVKIRRPIAFLLSLILILGIAAGVVWLVIPELISAVKVISQSALEIIYQLAKMKNEDNPKLDSIFNLLSKVNWRNLASTLEKWITDQSGNLVNVAKDTIVSFVGGIINAVFALIFSIYILFSKETLKRQSKRLIRAWIPQKQGDWFIHASSVANGIFRNFISGQTIEAFILGSLCAIGMLILRIPYAPMVGALIGVCAFIPVIGAFIGGGIGAFMIFTESPIKAVVFIIFLIILQQIEGNLIYPKVMGNKIKLPAIWVLATVTVGSALAGPMGILLGIPLASTAYILIREATESREEKLGITACVKTTDTSEPTEKTE